MPVVISMLRGVNLTTHNRIKMDALCDIYRSLKLEDPRTYVQSGNVIFRTRAVDPAALSQKIRDGIERKAGFRCDVILRTPAELRGAIAGNPFAGRRNLEPGKLLVTFLANEPSAEGREKVLALKPSPEELHLIGRELYIYFPNGAGRSTLPWASLPGKLGTTGTARNWKSVTKILAIAEEMEARR